MLIPLAIGLFIRSHSPESAAHWQPVMNKISGLAILVLLVVGLGLNVTNILNLIGTGGILALLLFIAGSLLIGYFLGGRDPSIRSVMGLGTAQRNVAAALVVTTQNFAGTDTLPFVLVAAILLLLILLPLAKRIGARAGAAAPVDTPTAS
jgi:BASS family bile acid:Na+ symporter